MPGTDQYQQSIPYRKLSDAPNIETEASMVNGLVAKSNMIFANATSRNAALPSPVAGMECWLTAEGRKEVYDGSTWRPYAPAPGLWTPFVPVWTATVASPVLGDNGVLTSRWTKIGRLVIWNGQLTLGSLSNGGTGLWHLTVPVAPASAAPGFTQWRGECSYFKPGDNDYLGHVIITPGSTIADFVVKTGSNAQSTSNVSNTVPVAAASGNVLTWEIQYESSS
ncbi:hypothetical protein [Kitasatospora fiedleri]|uniref:hypothetical protein n=1 Tax=Kitasatospora fiedleri TaxID=2991545 RepID=UPI00249CE30C|nr:hypothetical protein [Kitasatospora fiedleri]